MNTDGSIVGRKRLPSARTSRAIEPIHRLEARLMFADVTSSFLPKNDAFVRDGTYASVNAGVDPTLAVQKGTSPANRQSFLTFDTAASLGNVLSAKLRLYGKLSATGTSTASVALYPVATTTWSESTITWAGKPPTGTTAIATKSVSTTAVWQEWDVTSYVSAQRLLGRGTVSFALVATTANASPIVYNSEENASNKPALVVTARPAAPAIPTAVTAAASDLRITLTWQPSLGATSYNVYRMAESDADLGYDYLPFQIGLTSSSTIDFVGVENTRYRYQVTAVNGVGESDRSAVVAATTTAIPTGLPQVLQVNPLSQAVQVSAGTVKMADGSTVQVRGGLLTLDAPDIVSQTYVGPAPKDYVTTPAHYRWLDQDANLVPPTDTEVLGGLYHGVLPSSVVVHDSTGKVMVRDVDYKQNDDWGQIANLNGRLGTPLTGSVSIDYRAVLERLDLIEAFADGSVSVVRGTSAVSCPELPNPDEGAVALAGVHVYTLDGAKTSGFFILQRDINKIAPAAQVAPINPDRIPLTLAKLQAGQNVNIAIFGDSITAGAEAGNFRTDRSKGYAQRVIAGLNARFPQSHVTETQAHMNGVSALAGESTFQNYVLNPHNAGNRVDLLIIAMGMNDLGKPNFDAFNAAMTSYIDRARAAGMEVLLVTPLQSNPYYDSVFTDWVPRSQIAGAIRTLAVQKQVACADVYTEWVNQATHGIAPVSQLHNWFNHPGERGHQLYADTILRFFPQQPTSAVDAYVRAYQAADVLTPPPVSPVLFLGSSTMGRWKTLATDFPTLTVLNRGLEGATTADQVLYESQMALSYEPSKIVYYDGDNDLAKGWTAGQVLEGFRTFVRIARQDNPMTPIIFLSIKPSPARAALQAVQQQANTLIRNWIVGGGDSNLKYVDVATPMLSSTGAIRPELYVADGLHLSAAGYAIWKSVLTPVLT